MRAPRIACHGLRADVTLACSLKSEAERRPRVNQASRRSFLKLGAGTLAVAALDPVARASDAGLAEPAFRPLALGDIVPAGWLLRQLRIQADGMGGHLDEFWPDVGSNSGWLGGAGESWERGPYFVDGLLPLAWQLNDKRLKEKALRFVNWTLEHQQANGMIGPPSNDDWWPRMVMVKVLAQYHDATQDPRVLEVLTRYFHFQLEALPARPLKEWGKYRWQDEAYVVQWLYDRTHDAKLRGLLELLEQQGFDWVASFRDFRYTGPTTKDFLDAHDSTGNKPEGMQTHGVNNGQALKTAAVRYRGNRDVAERANYDRQVATLDRFHGMPNGMFSCDEHLAGLDPVHGTELCTVVETLFSMEVALSTFGDPAIADRIEKIAFNALPGTFTDDMWAHQYDQQPNQVQSSLNSKPWTTNGPESNLYGLAPHFGCCTANFHQGWPKFTQSLWMRTPDDGLAAMLYAPCEISTLVQRRKVTLTVDTDYPFRNTVRIRVMPEGAIQCPILLRIPGWANGATVLVNGVTENVPIKPGSFARIVRTWRPGDRIELRLPMMPAITRGYRDSITLVRGPIVFSHSPGESWVKLREQGPTADWQVFPQAAWNYALKVDERSVGRLEVVEGAVGASPFAAHGTALQLRVPGRQLNAWRAVDGVAGSLPEGSVTSSEPEVMLTLIPYAAAKLRITAFPQLRSEAVPPPA